MSSNSETGHAKNISNFASLISFCKGYGTTYNPSRDALKTANLDVQYDAAAASLTDVIQTKNSFDTMVNARKEVFKPLKKFSTKIINALDATDATPATVDDAKTINRKIQGSRAGGKTKTPAETDGPKNISVSQQSFDQQVEHFASLVTLLSAEPAYAPNEDDLTIIALNKVLANMRKSNQDVIDANTAIENSRIKRNNLLYQEPTGLVPIALDVKKYVKSVFESTSPEFKQVSKIEFTRLRE